MNFSNSGKTAGDKFSEFKVIARRNKKVELWAAKLLGIPPGEAERLVSDIEAKIASDPDDAQLIKSLIQHLQENFVSMSEKQIRRQMDIFYQEAKMELATKGR